NVDLGAGANSVLNDAGAVFIAFSEIDLRDGPGGPATFTNAGEFLMGLGAPAAPIDLAGGETFADLDGVGDPLTNLLYGARVINTVALDGNFIQTADGHMAFDVAFGPYASDRVNVTGDAIVDGTGDVTLTWLENSDEVTLFATGGLGVDNGLEITDTLAMDYSVRADAQGVHLSFTTNFGQSFLNEDGQVLGGHMDRAIDLGGSSGIGQLMALIGNLQAGDEALYASIFQELNPEPHLAPLHTQFASANSFARQMFTCGTGMATVREQCVWAEMQTVSTDQAGDFQDFAVDATTVSFRTGFERPIDDEWSIAGAVGYDYLDMRVDRSRAHTQGSGLNLGLGLRRIVANGAEFGLTASGGWQWLETDRRVDVFSPGVARSEPETGYLQAGAHVAHTLRNGALVLRPALNRRITMLHQEGFTEEGIAGLGVEALGQTQTFGTLNPELTFGAVLQEDAARRAAVTFNVGALFHSEDRIDAPFRLLGANAAALPANIG